VASSGKNSGTSSNNNINSSNNNNNRLLPPDKLRKNHINSNCKQRSLSMSLSDSPPLSLYLFPSRLLSLYRFMQISFRYFWLIRWQQLVIINGDTLQLFPLSQYKRLRQRTCQPSHLSITIAAFLQPRHMPYQCHLWCSCKHSRQSP